MKKVLLITLALMAFNQVFSQNDTLFFDANYNEVKRSDGYEYYFVFEYFDEYQWFDGDIYTADSVLHISGRYSCINPLVRNGEFVFYSKDRRKSITLIYSSDTLKIGENFLPDKFDTYNLPLINYSTVETKPEFYGGVNKLMEFLSKNTEYPNKAIRKGIEGRVFVQFVIETNGKVTNVEVIKGVHPLLDTEAERVVKKIPRWKPGKHNGQKVRVSFVVPINFKLRPKK